jgi:uncharacterized Zn finger protein (UPF0148 family)
MLQCAVTFYRGCQQMTDEDLTEIERAGRRCAVCRTGRRWRQFEVVRPAGREPVVMCPSCKARYGDAPPTSERQKPVETPAPEPEEQPKAAPRSHKPAQPREDRLKRALRELPRGEHSTGRIAKAAGLNHSKTLGRLHQLAAAGEIQPVGKRWSTERPSTDLEAAFDRLQARTSNVRVVRERQSD